MPNDAETSAKLTEYCRRFIAEQRIECAETIYQTDRVAENACEFIEGICDILGYALGEG